MRPRIRIKKPTVYYAHCMALYGGNTERQDIKNLERMGFKVDNPNSAKHKKIVASMRANRKTSKEIMDYFVKVVRKADGLAFRALPDGSISAGVHKEVQAMYIKGGFVIELPEYKSRKFLSVEETRAYLRGKR